MSMPVEHFSFLDCLLSNQGDTPGASDESIGELLQVLKVFRLHWVIVSQSVVSLLQDCGFDALHIDLLEVQPKNSMDVASTSALELDPITYVSHPHWVVTPIDDFFPERFHSVLEVSGGQEDISPDQLVLRFVHIFIEVLLPRKFHNLAINIGLHCDPFLTF